MLAPVFVLPWEAAITAWALFCLPVQFPLSRDFGLGSSDASVFVALDVIEEVTEMGSLRTTDQASASATGFWSTWGIGYLLISYIHSSQQFIPILIQFILAATV